jgi:perosamine synthetase
MTPERGGAAEGTASADVADSMNRPIPLFDCRLDKHAHAAVGGVFASGRLTAGPQLVALERALGPWVGNRPVVGMIDSTHALALALHLAGVKSGDEVMTLAFNCLSSNSAISHVGAVPVWVDVDPDTATINLSDCEAALTSRTRALVVYHVAGYPAQLASLQEWCASKQMPLIEDANNALGAHANGAWVGSAGDFAVLSFYPNRQINAIDGGALICRDAQSAHRASALRRFGIDVTRFRDARGEIDPAVDITEIGLSAPLNDVHATLALHGLGTLEQRLGRNRAHVEWLVEATRPLTHIRPVHWNAADAPAFWTWLVRCRNRDAVMAHLKRRGIGCSTLHQPNDRYTCFGATPRALPGTRTLMNEVLALPCGWWLERDDLSRIVEELSVAEMAT